jgi:hypothetical protein
MIRFNKPANLNGAEPKQELNAAGIVFIDEVDGLHLKGDDLLINISENDAELALPIVNSHNGTVIAPEPTVADKLAAAGLTVEELKSALGLN